MRAGFILSTTIFLYQAAALACSCAPPDSVSDEYREANVVYVARVLETIEDQDYHVSVRTSVVENFKGLSWQPELTIRTAADSAMCGFKFDVDETYLVYGYITTDGVIQTNICMRTKAASDAEDEIAELRELASK